MQEKILKSRSIFDGRIVKLAVHEVELPNGKTAVRELVQHAGAVAIVAIDEADNVLLIRQYRIGASQILNELPAGTLEPGEAPELCAERELREETGYRPGKLEPIGGWYMAPGYSTEYIHLFIATDLTEDPTDADEDEFIERFKVPFDQALEMVKNGEMGNSTAVAGLLRAAQHLGR